MYVKNNEVIYFHGLGVEHVHKEIMHFTGNKNIKTNIFKIQADNSIISGYFCIGFVNYMLSGKTLVDYTSFFSPYDFERNDKIILSFFKMNESNSIETHSNLNLISLNDHKKFRLNEINKIKDYFNSEIQEIKTVSKKRSKYIAAFDYTDMTLIVSSATSGEISIIIFFYKCFLKFLQE